MDYMFIPEVVKETSPDLTGLYVLLFIVGLMWLMEPMLKSFLLTKYKESTFILYIYKMVGLGLLVIIGYAIYLF